MDDERRLAAALLALRASVVVVLLAWTLDKLARPGHAAGVYAHFYLLRGWGPVAMRAAGGAELLLLAAFGVGYRRRLSYGAVLALHAVSTLSSWRQYLAPFQGADLLFFAAWPMLAACWVLYLLREHDVWLSVDGDTRGETAAAKWTV
ncbi:MAG: hypothetical protein KGL53_05910 [Elusimicrobia bacterium]|nr:hypothetical protein [Elusimicrobiota bacterium]